MSIEVEVPDGFRSAGIRHAKEGELYMGYNGVRFGPSTYQEIILVPQGCPPTHVETVEVLAPEGWEVVRWGVPRPDDYYVNNCGPKLCHVDDMDTKWLIVRPKKWATPQLPERPKARFRDHEDEEWVEGYLTGQRQDGVFLDENGTPWRICEVYRGD